MKRLKGPSGGIVEKAIDILLEAVRTGTMVQQDAKKFAGGLDQKVMGRYIHNENKGNFQYNDRAMEKILEDFYKVKAYSLEAQDTVAAIVGALKEAGLAFLAHEIETACKKEGDGEQSASQSTDQQQGQTHQPQSDIPSPNGLSATNYHVEGNVVNVSGTFNGGINM